MCLYLWCERQTKHHTIKSSDKWCISGLMLKALNIIKIAVTWEVLGWQMRAIKSIVESAIEWFLKFKLLLGKFPKKILRHSHQVKWPERKCFQVFLISSQYFSCSQHMWRLNSIRQSMSQFFTAQILSCKIQHIRNEKITPCSSLLFECAQCENKLLIWWL